MGEPGSAMHLPLHIGPWSRMQAAAAPLRLAVFVVEQHVPEDMEWDEDDAVSLHAVIFDSAGAPAATGRLLPPAPADAVHDAGISHIGRMAVARTARGQGLGGRVLDALLAEARRRGDRGVVLHAQRSAEGFYATRGFVSQGEPFEEAGIDHIAMELRFPPSTL